MYNPLTSRRIPRFKDDSVRFSKLYHISTNKSTDITKEFEGLGQACSPTCFYASARSDLANSFGIFFSREDDFTKLLTDIDRRKSLLYGKSYDEEKNNIKKVGFRVKDVKNIADFFDIGAFNSNKANMHELTALIDLGINPIVFRSVNRKDKEGHFVVAYAKDNDFIYFFDPAYVGKRPKENLAHKGRYRKESHEKFLYRWTNEFLDGGFVFFYDKGERPKLDLDGYYLT